MVYSLDGLTGQLLAVTVSTAPGVVAALGDASVPAHEDQAVGAVVELRVAHHTLPVAVAVGDVPDDSGLEVAWVGLLQGLGVAWAGREGERKVRRTATYCGQDGQYSPR